MTLTSCVSKLLGSGGFCSVDSWVALWSRFVFLAVIVGSVTGLGVLDLVLRSWVGVFSWLGVSLWGGLCVCGCGPVGGLCWRGPVVQVFGHNFLEYLLSELVD